MTKNSVKFRNLLRRYKKCIKITRIVEYGREHFELDAIKRVEFLRKKVWKYEFLLTFDELKLVFNSIVMNKYILKNTYRYD